MMNAHIYCVTNKVNGKQSDATRSKMSQAAKLRPVLTCPHCSKTGGFNGMKVHHMDNCKVKDNK